MAKNNPEIRFKKMGAYGETEGKTIWLNKSKFKGIEGLDTITHEKLHVSNMKASEGDIIKKTEKHMNSYLSII